jgi:glucosamine-6-phosphate deaminase
VTRPHLIVVDDPEAAAAVAVARVLALLAAKPWAVLGLATGETMRPIHRGLVGARQRGAVSFAQARSFNLDEYVGLRPGHPGSFAAFMRRTLFDAVDFAPGATQLPEGNDPAAYEAAIQAAGGIDLQLLGIGGNGHIGFNEPGSGFASRTRIVQLAAATRIDNAASFAPDPVPERAVTMGIGTILAARSIVLVATGGAKARAVARALGPEMSPDCPASALRLHPAAVIVADRAAAAGLT